MFSKHNNEDAIQLCLFPGFKAEANILHYGTGPHSLNQKKYVAGWLLLGWKALETMMPHIFYS